MYHLNQGAPVALPEHVEVVVGTLDDVRYVPVVDGDDNDDDEDASDGTDATNSDINVTRRRTHAKGGAGDDGAKEKQTHATSSNVTDLTLDARGDGEEEEEEEEDEDSVYNTVSAAADDQKDIAASEKARSMAMRIAASLRPRSANDDDAETESVCSLCNEEIGDAALMSACVHCNVQYHATCVANAMLDSANAPPETLLPSRGLPSSARWECSACGMPFTWEESMKAGLTSQRLGRLGRRRRKRQR